MEVLMICVEGIIFNDEVHVWDIYIYVVLCWHSNMGLSGRYIIDVSRYLVHLTHRLFFRGHMAKLLLLLYGKSEILEPLSALIVSPRAALIF
jgi:hypothetical protein